MYRPLPGSPVKLALMANGISSLLTPPATRYAEPRVARDGTDGKAALALLAEAARRVLGHADFVELLQLSRRGGVAVFERDGRRMVFKLIGCRADRRKRLARFFGWNPARGAHRLSGALRERGLPVCVVEEHGAVSLPSAPRAVWTISEFLEGSRTLRVYKRETQKPQRASAVHPEIRSLFQQGIELLRRLHDAGFEHRDFHAGNLLVSRDEAGEPALRMLDLETVVRRDPRTAGRARDLCRFVENFVEPENYREVIAAALRDYATGDEGLERRLLGNRYTRRLLAYKGQSKRNRVREQLARSGQQ